MGLFSFKRRKKEKIEFLLQWQRAVMLNSPNRLVMTEQQLKSFTSQQVKDDLRIIKDCLALVERTYKPEVFFPRLNLFAEKAKHLASLEKYASRDGVPIDILTRSYNKTVSKYDEMVKWFLIRYHTDVHGTASALKTSKARLNRYQKWYDSLQPYYLYMCSEHIDYIETEYNRHMEKNR